MTPEELAAIRERAENATAGPWEEEWRNIPGHPGYQVSDFGNVRSFFKKGNHKSKWTQEARTLKLVASRGYRTVSISDGTGYRHKLVHGLVMLAFVGPRPEGSEVAHLNGIPSDNRRANLAYVSHVENESHKVAHGTKGVGEKNAAAILQGWQVAEVKYLAARSVPQGRIAELFDLSHKAVSQILAGRTWSLAEAREDVPALLAEVERLTEERDQWEDAAKIRWARLQRLEPDLATAEARLDKVRALADWWATLADGDKHYAARILAALDGDGQP